MSIKHGSMILLFGGINFLVPPVVVFRSAGVDVSLTTASVAEAGQRGSNGGRHDAPGRNRQVHGGSDEAGKDHRDKDHRDKREVSENEEASGSEEPQQNPTDSDSPDNSSSTAPRGPAG